MNKQVIDPTRFGYSHAWRVEQPQTVVFVAGQIASDETGRLVGEGDLEAQTRQVFTNVGRVLEQAGMSFENVVQLGVFLTDIGQVEAYGHVRNEFVNTAAPPASTLVGVTGLARSGALVEVNAVAVG